MEKMRILFAAPDRDLLECYKKILEPDFGEVVTAFDGTQILFLLSAENFDVLILDRDIPRIEHKKLITRAKEKKTPVIVLIDSPITTHELIAETLPSAYLSYPFTPVQLGDKIRNTTGKALCNNHLNVGDIDVDVSEFKINDSVSLTADETDVLEAVLQGEGVIADNTVNVSALNIKFEKVGSKTRIKYRMKKGFELVTQNE